MVYVVALVALGAFTGIVWLLLRNQAAQVAAWAEERRELLNRIQLPELVPIPGSPHYSYEYPDADEIELVGTIQEPKE